MLMMIFCWLVLGVLAGFLVSKVITGHGHGLIPDMAIGIAGALIGGWLATSVGTVGAARFSFWSLLGASVGAAVLLLIWRIVRGKLSRQ